MTDSTSKSCAHQDDASLPAPDLGYSGTELDTLAGAANYHSWVLSKFERYLGETVAEVGAGIGSVSRLLLNTSIKHLLAFEPSHNMFPFLAEGLRGQPRAEAINDFFDRRFTPQGVDSLIYVNVMEHIEDHRGELQKAYEALRPNGHVLVFVPALNCLYSEFDRHIGHYRRYTKRGLVDLAQSVGFNVVKAQYFDIAGIIPWFVAFKLLKGRPRPGSVAIYDKLVVPPMRILEGLIPPPIGKSVLLVAKKTDGSGQSIQ